jgi:NAD-dependent SIR2 family protein deacetylase
MENIKKATEVIKSASHILITAGAGMGVDSGLPDFRGKEGFWRAYPIAKKLGLSFEALANPKWFDVNPKLAWAFYGHRLKMYRETIPHEGFNILLNLPQDKFVFTSNVDGHFQKAGFSELKIVEIHGSIHYLQCTKPCNDDIWENNENIEINEEKFEALNFPKCKNCGIIARPNILMFGDFRFVDKRVKLQLARFEYWLQRVENLVIIEIGAGTSVPTVRNMSERVKNSLNATLIRINPIESFGADIQINKGALEALKEIKKYL